MKRDIDINEMNIQLDDDVFNYLKKKLEEEQKKIMNSSKTSVQPSTLQSKASKNTKGIGFDYSNYNYEAKEVVEDTSNKKKKNNSAPSGSIAAKANKLRNNID